MNPICRPGMIARCIVLGLLALPAGAAVPEPRLILSPVLTHPQIGDTERSLLRVEWKATRTRDDEVAAVDDILVRVQRMEGTVAEVRHLVYTLPTIDTSTLPVPVDATAEDAIAWWGVGGAGVALSLLAGWLVFRPRRSPAAVTSTTPVPPSIPNTPPKKTECPPAQIFEEPETLQEGMPEAKAGRLRRRPLRSPEQGAAQASAEDARPANATTPAPPGGATDVTRLVAGSSPLGGDNRMSPAPDDQALELANIMLSMGLAHGAARTLEDHIRLHPRQALYHWLKLLDIYRRSGMQKQFDESAHDLRQHFNVHAFEWQRDAGDTTPVQSTIEDYPHIIGQVQEHWPTPACTDYLTRLLEDNRGGTRIGFPETVAEEILLLLGMLGTHNGHG